MRGRTIRSTIDTELGILRREQVEKLIADQGFPEIQTRLHTFHRAGQRLAKKGNRQEHPQNPSVVSAFRAFVLIAGLFRMQGVQRIKDGDKIATNMKEMLFVQADILKAVQGGQGGGASAGPGKAARDADTDIRLVAVEQKLDAILKKLNA